MNMKHLVILFIMMCSFQIMPFTPTGGEIYGFATLSAIPWKFICHHSGIRYFLAHGPFFAVVPISAESEER